MSIYESTFICSPDLPTEKIDELIEKVKKTVETTSGTVAVTQQLGRKRLAYPIKKFREGSYVYLEITGTGATISALENFYKVNDTIIRFLTVKVEKKKTVKKAAASTAETVQPAAKEEVKPNESAEQSSTTGAE